MYLYATIYCCFSDLCYFFTTLCGLFTLICAKENRYRRSVVTGNRSVKKTLVVGRGLVATQVDREGRRQTQVHGNASALMHATPMESRALLQPRACPERTCLVAASPVQRLHGSSGHAPQAVAHPLAAA
jgi:hypothetical protein